MSKIWTDPVVFVGPSLARDELRRALPRAEIAPPIARGDLERYRADGAGTFLIIDGMFAQQLAVAPSEIVFALQDGAQILGASSIGAIRAAECRPAGMEGLGAVYLLYRLRLICNDDEVAVATNPDDDFAALSIALVNIRYVLLAALRARLLDRDDARAVLTVAKGTHFSQRHWRTIFSQAGVAFEPALKRLADETDIKRRDARRAVEHVGRLPPPTGFVAPIASVAPLRTERAVPHDPHLGYSIEDLRQELPRWLLATGRYRRYVGTAVPDADPKRVAQNLWAELERGGARETELMRWYAVQRWSALEPGPPEERWLSDAQSAIAKGHGFGAWSELVAKAAGGDLAGVPIDWILDARQSLATARRNLHAHSS